METSRAPLVCSAILPLQSLPPTSASFRATSSIALSGVVMKTTRECRTWHVSSPRGWPAPIARTAMRAEETDRAVTLPMRHPSSCRRRPSARPTRPAPTMDTVSDIRCVSILEAATNRAADTLHLHTIFIVLFSLIAFVWIVQGIRAGIGMSRLPWLSDVAPIAFPAGAEPAPLVSILFSARDEAEKLPAALATLLAQDYPRFEIIAVND